MYLATASSPSELYEIDVDSGNASFITTLLISNPTTTLFKNLSTGYLTYYYTIYDSGYYTLYSVTNSVVTVVDTQFNGGSSFSIDSTGNYLYFTWYYPEVALYQYTISNGIVTTLNGTSQGDFPLSPNCDSLYEASYNGADSVVISTGVLFTASCGSGTDETFAVYSFSSVTTDYLTYGWDYSQAGFFQCEAETLDHLPLNPYMLSSFCSSNGIVWSTVNFDIRYFLPSYAEAYMQSLAAEQCPASLDMICTSVGDLPPYICSKKDYLPFFTILSTALANAQSLLTILFLVFGFLLPNISKWLGVAVPKGPDDEQSKAGDVEMGAISPVHAVTEDVNVK